MPVHDAQVMLTANEQAIIEALRLLPGGATMTITKNGRNSDVEYFMETTEKRLLKMPPRPAPPMEPHVRGIPASHDRRIVDPRIHPLQ